MTVLVSDLGNTVVASYKQGTFKLADWTVMPTVGLYGDFMNKHPWFSNRASAWLQKKAENKRIKEGFQVGEERPASPTLQDLAEEKQLGEDDLSRKLALAIRKTADDLKAGIPKKYDYEEWVEFTRLIRFTTRSLEELEEDEDHGVVNWDWIGEDSPMLADKSETEWVLDRLCESLDRYMRQHSSHRTCKDITEKEEPRTNEEV